MSEHLQAPLEAQNDESLLPPYTCAAMLARESYPTILSYPPPIRLLSGATILSPRPVAHDSDSRGRVHRTGGGAWLRVPPRQARVRAAHTLASEHAVAAASVRIHTDWRGRRRGQRGRCSW